MAQSHKALRDRAALRVLMQPGGTCCRRSAEVLLRRHAKPQEGDLNAATNVGVFAVVCRVGRDLDDFIGFGRASGWGGAALVVFLLSLVGVPRLAGFFGKLLLFGAALDAGFGWVAVIAIANSVLSLGVYMRLIVPVYRSVAPTRRAVRIGSVSLVSPGLVVGVQGLLGHAG